MTQLEDATIDRLIAAAAEVQSNAHAPYSDFRVGAAVLDSCGEIHVGCNVENASYGLSVCAERHAVAAAVAAGAEGLEAVAVVTDTSPPASPCGACRQVLREFGELAVILANPAGEQKLTSTGALLPNAFTPEALLE